MCQIKFNAQGDTVQGRISYISGNLPYTIPPRALNLSDSPNLRTCLHADKEMPLLLQYVVMCVNDVYV